MTRRSAQERPRALQPSFRFSRFRTPLLGLATAVVLTAGAASPAAASAPECRLDAPGDVLAESLPDATVRITWGYVPDATEYRVYNASNGSELLATITDGSHSFLVSSPPLCVEQLYFVRAFGDGFCASDPSNFAAGTAVLVEPSRARADFNGDGLTDLSVFRPEGGHWLWESHDGDIPGSGSQQWGQQGDTPVPGDYDGDGTTDPAIFRPGVREWWILLSCGDRVAVVPWGLGTDEPVAADYDGDGKTDPAIYRPSSGYFWVLRSSDGLPAGMPVGLPWGDPVPRDYDGDGIADFAVVHSADGRLEWTIVSSDGSWQHSEVFGKEGDEPIPADYDGDGIADLATFRSSPAQCLIQYAGGNQDVVNLGVTATRCAPGSYTLSDGKARCAAVDDSDPNVNWWIDESDKAAPIHGHPFGEPGDIPLPPLDLGP